MGKYKFMNVTLPVQSGFEAVGDVRRSVSSLLSDWGLSSIRDSAELVISELITNAKTHGLSSNDSDELPIKVSVSTKGRTVRIEVHDSRADNLPIVKESDLDSESGRGLAIVSMLSADWGVDVDSDGSGKTVWAELSY